jgi:uncharacterized membrane protein YphA (DoxX/SURF4 family)
MTTSTASQAANSAGSNAKSGGGILASIARILLGLLFFVAGLNGFLNFIPQPKTPMPEGAMAFAGALMATHYMFQLIAGTQALVGVLLLVNRFVPLALVLIAPVIVNIIAFHLFLQPAGIVPGSIALILEIYLVHAYRNAFRPMLAMRALPGGK